MPITPGRILQVSLSPGGLPKTAVAAARATLNGLEGDLHRHPKIHGGPAKALLVITAEGLEELAATGFPVSWGAMGENLTIRGIPRQSIRAGQRYDAGEARIEITTLREPCRQLDVYGRRLRRLVKADSEGSPAWGLGGFYARVIREGVIRPGDRIAIVSPA